MACSTPRTLLTPTDANAAPPGQPCTDTPRPDAVPDKPAPAPAQHKSPDPPTAEAALRRCQSRQPPDHQEARPGDPSGAPVAEVLSACSFRHPHVQLGVLAATVVEGDAAGPVKGHHQLARISVD